MWQQGESPCPGAEPGATVWMTRGIVRRKRAGFQAAKPHKRDLLRSGIVKDAYNMLVNYRNRLEDDGKAEVAEHVSNTSKLLWIHCLNEKAPWSGEPACDNPGFKEEA